MPFLNSLQRITLYLFFFSINFEVVRPFPGVDLAASRIIGALYFLSILPDYKSFFRTDQLKSFLIPLVLFYVFLTFMGLINMNELNTNFFDSSILLNMIFFWVMINHERKEYMILEKSMMFFAIGGVVVGLFFLAGIGTIYQEGRLSMFGDDQNYVGFRTTVATIILVMAVLQNRLKMGRIRFLFLIPIPLMLNLISETGSRGALISFLMTFIAGIILFKAKNLWKKIAIQIAGILMLLIVGTYLIETGTMKRRMENSIEGGDTAGRTEIWQNLLHIIEKHPITGIGQTGYTYELTMIYGTEVAAHNVILEVLCYTGIVGLSFYLFFLYKIGLSSYEVYKKTSFILPILLLIPILGMILSIQILTKKFGWVIFAYIVSTMAIKNTKRHQLVKKTVNTDPFQPKLIQNLKS